MPLQWLNLDQSIYKKKPPQWGASRTPARSPISQALTPQQGGGGGFAAAGGTAPNRFVEEQKAKWAEEDKLKKLEREQKIKEAQEMGMRIQNAYKEEQARSRQMSAQTQQQRTLAQAQQQGAERQKIEDNPEPAAKEMYELLKTMPDEVQEKLLNQIFTPTTPKGGISSAGETITMPEKYNPIAGVFLSKGWATIDKAGKAVLSEPEREFEKGTFEIVEKGGKVYKFNTATNEETLLGSIDEPESVLAEINKDANTQALAIAKASAGTKDVITFTEAKFDVLKDSYNMTDEEAVDLSKINELPKEARGTPWYTKLIDWVKGKKPKEPTKEDWEKAAGKITGETFNETNVSALVDVISDDVTTAERAHLKNQGASDADINEAIKRKGSK